MTTTERFLTTGQAAEQLSVTPDTVLKWIRSGRLAARRTAGGHHRISLFEIERILMVSANDRGFHHEHKQLAGRFQFCWEYYGRGDLHNSCRDCAVYRMRAQRCYEVVKLAPELEHPKTFCKRDCGDCEYYRIVKGQAPNVLLVTDDSSLVTDMRRDESRADYNLKVADCEYACSALVDSFRPDFAIIDCLLGKRASGDMARHLKSDPRIPNVRIILAGAEDEFPAECCGEVFAKIERPFGVSEVNDCIKGFRGTGNTGVT